MEWHYSKDGKLCGPVTRAEFDDLVRKGVVKSDTLIWRAGMPDWQRFSTLPAELGGDTARCAECGKFFLTSGMVHYQELWVCASCKPVFLQKLKEGVGVPGLALWRSGKNLVLQHGAELPARCVRCNAPASGAKLERKLHWHHPLIYLLILPSCLIYIIVALIVQKKATVHVGLCQAHRSRRIRDIAIAWLVFVVGACLFFSNMIPWRPLPFCLGLTGMLGGIGYGIIRDRVVYPRRINKEHVWLSGVCEEFLAPLPEWDGPS